MDQGGDEEGDCRLDLAIGPPHHGSGSAGEVHGCCRPGRRQGRWASTFTGMDGDGSEAQRLAIVARVLESPPAVHPSAPNGKVWRTDRRCYEFMASQVRPGSRTLETGAGVSTVLFTAWGCRHIAVVPSPAEEMIIREYCAEMDFDTSLLTFDLRPSELALPGMTELGELDLMFIDGAHSFPMPIIDWFYGAGHLRKGGVVVFDDLPLPAVSTFLNSFVERDDRWQQIGSSPKWRAYRRLSEGSLAEHEFQQPFFQGDQPNVRTRAIRILKDLVPLSIRQELARSESSSRRHRSQP